jgi:hypothetical protein
MPSTRHNAGLRRAWAMWCVNCKAPPPLASASGWPACRLRCAPARSWPCRCLWQRPGGAGRRAVRCARPAVRQAKLAGQPLPARPALLVTRGVARVPEDRHAVGVVGDLPVWENAVSERLRSAGFSRWLGWIWVRRAAARAHARAKVLEAFDVRGGGAADGGPVAVGRQHAEADPGPRPAAPGLPTAAITPRLIVAHQPTWGLDIGAVAYVQEQLIAARDAGAAVLLISDDLDEVLALGDRVAVMHAGESGRRCLAGRALDARGHRVGHGRA